MVPRIIPLPTGFWPARKKPIPTIIAIQIAREAYFFCVALTESIPPIFPVAPFVFNYLHDLTVYGDGAADDTQNSKNRYKYSSNSQPLVQI